MSRHERTTGNALSRRDALSVALVSTQRGWHGGEGQAHLIADGLRSRGHTCRILARRGGQFAERMQSEDFDVVSFSGNGWSPTALWEIRRCLVQFRPDVLHYNDPHAMTAAGMASMGLPIAARIASRRVDFPVRSAGCYRLFCDRVLCVSRRVQNVCRRGGIPPRQTCVVHEGVDPDRVRSGDRRRGRRAIGLAEGHPLLLTVATLTDHKGHRFLLDALPAVVREHPDVCLALAGDGPLGDELRRQARRLGIDSHVRFLGYRKDVPDLIMAADLFVLPSHLEGLCTSLIDVMCAGRPIVATTAGGIPDLVGLGDADAGPLAWLVPPRDPSALAKAIQEALASAEQRAVRQRRAQQRAVRTFTANHMVEATLAVYRAVLAERSSPGTQHGDLHKAA